MKLKSTSNLISTNEAKSFYLEPFTFKSPKFSNNQLKKTSHSLDLTCSSDILNDIYLNNKSSSSSSFPNIPPFKDAFNLECISDGDQSPLISDDINDLFTFCVNNNNNNNEQCDENNNTENTIIKTNDQINKKKRSFESVTESIESLNTSFNSTNTTLIEQVQPTTSKKIKTEQQKSSDNQFDKIDFACETIRKVFSKDELKKSIIPDKNNLTRSKIKTAFDSVKLDQVKGMNHYIK